MASKRKKTIVSPSAVKKYPYNTLRQCMKLAEVVKQHGGDSASVPKSVIAQELEMGLGSSVLNQLVASAKNYGIVDGLQELRLTEIGREYFFPLSDKGQRAAELEFLIQPAAFEYLVKRFDGTRLPSPNILANELARNCGVTESWRGRAASFFINTAQDMGVIDAGNFLRYSAAKHSAGLASKTTATDSDEVSDDDELQNAISDDGTTSSAAQTRSPSRPAPAVGSYGGNVWVYRDSSGGAVRLETPDTLSSALWQKLKSYVDILKPDDQGKEG